MSHTANTAIDWKKLEVLAQQQLPSFVLDRAPNLVAFLQAYYEWLDSEDNPNYSLRNLRHWRDVDRTLDRFVDWFHNEFLVRIPKDALADRRLLIHHIKQFYRSKGSQKSYKFLFRILYDEDLDFYYPGRDMLRFSDAPWVVDKYLNVNLLVTESYLFNTEGLELRGNSSGARSRIERVESSVSGGIPSYYVYYGKTIGSFSNGEIVTANGVQIGSVNSTVTNEGYYVGSEGFNSLKKIQDSWYYQEYSYELQSGIVINEYRDIVKELVHPAGTKLFGKFSLVTVFDAFAGFSPEFDTQPYNVFIEPTIITQIPEVISAVGFGGDAAALVILLLVLDLPDVEVPPATIQYQSANTTGYFRIANSDVMSDYDNDPMSWWDDWSEAEFLGGKGAIGTGTLWESEIPMTNSYFSKSGWIYDGQAVNPNTMVIVRQVSANTVMKFGPAYFDTTSANLYFAPIWTAFTPIYSYPVGTFRVSNTDIINAYPGFTIDQFASWTIDDFTNGRGLVGTGTAWNTQLAPTVANSHWGDPLIIDGDNYYQNGSFVLSAVDSSNTALIANSYYSPTSNAAANLSFRLTEFV